MNSLIFVLLMCSLSHFSSVVSFGLSQAGFDWSLHRPFGYSHYESGGTLPDHQCLFDTDKQLKDGHTSCHIPDIITIVQGKIQEKERIIIIVVQTIADKKFEEGRTFSVSHLPDIINNVKDTIQGKEGIIVILVKAMTGKTITLNIEAIIVIVVQTIADKQFEEGRTLSGYLLSGYLCEDVDRQESVPFIGRDKAKIQDKKCISPTQWRLTITDKQFEEGRTLLVHISLNSLDKQLEDGHTLSAWPFGYNVKDKLQDKDAFQPFQQRLVFVDMPLEDDHTPLDHFCEDFDEQDSMPPIGRDKAKIQDNKAITPTQWRLAITDKQFEEGRTISVRISLNSLDEQLEDGHSLSALIGDVKANIPDNKGSSPTMRCLIIASKRLEEDRTLSNNTPGFGI